ncbi:uncharacterized protein LOC119388871 isoform X2 [Rhipicephalus sanguineus]|uniref:uncharacterized protein LOC119388871 isoform X2 n=1 Tax=Rhipicephalus sanguineus TaxID=34632 RepID=UPI0018942E7C|nr:uncharacterized protein LOC119388871 isoform X2 [Rhipicephalus sanguineus]
MGARSTCRPGRCFFRRSTLLLTVIIRLAAAAPVSGPAATTSRNDSMFDAAAAMAADHVEHASNASGLGNHLAANASDNAIFNTTGKVVRHKRTHHGHHLHHHHWSTGQTHGAGDLGPAQQFDNVLFRTMGVLDANTCLSKFVCEIVARRGASSFIGTTIGSLFAGFAHAPPSSPAHGLWRAAAIGKHGWLPVCTNAFPHCSSRFSTALSILNLIG